MRGVESSMSAFELWLLFTVVPNMNEVLCMIGMIGLCILAVAGMACGFESAWNDNLWERYISYAKRAVPALVACLLVAALLPSSTQIALIVGGSYATQLESVESIPPNLVKALNKALEDYAE